MSTTTAKPPRPMRLNRTKADLIPEARFAEWHRIASAAAGLSELDHQVLDVIASYYQLLDQRGYASFPSIEKMAQSSHKRSMDVTTAIKHPVELCLIAVRPGSGRWPNEYLMCLPRKLIASLSTATAEDAPAPLLALIRI